MSHGQTGFYVLPELVRFRPTMVAVYLPYDLRGGRNRKQPLLGRTSPSCLVVTWPQSLPLITKDIH